MNALQEKNEARTGESRRDKEMILAYIWNSIGKLSLPEQETVITMEALNAQLEDFYTEEVIFCNLSQLEKRGFIEIGRGPFGPEGQSVPFLKLKEEMRFEDLKGSQAMSNLTHADKRNKGGISLAEDKEVCAKEAAATLAETFEEIREEDIRIVFRAVKEIMQGMIRDYGEIIPYHISAMPKDMEAMESMLKIAHILNILAHSGYIEVDEHKMITMTEDQMSMEYAPVPEEGIIADFDACVEMFEPSYGRKTLLKLHARITSELWETAGRMTEKKLEEVIGEGPDSFAMKLFARGGHLILFRDGTQKVVAMTPEQIIREFR
jgi:hypothetical protein